VRSPGIYGLASQEIEKETGALTLYVSGAFGSTHNLSVPPKEAIFRLKAAIRTALKKARPIRVDVVQALKRKFFFSVRRFNEDQEDRAVSYYCRKRCEKRFAEYTIKVFRRMRAQLRPFQGRRQSTYIQALRIGPTAWVAAPGELFTVLGLDIKELSPFRYTFVANVANDWIGYIPDREAYRLGGYQLWTGLHSYVECGTGENFVFRSVELLKELAHPPSDSRNQK